MREEHTVRGQDVAIGRGVHEVREPDCDNEGEEDALYGLISNVLSRQFFLIQDDLPV